MSWLRLDWGLYLAALGLSLIGALLVWSGTHEDVGPALAVRHLINTGIGVSMAVLLLRADVRWIRAVAPWLYLAGLAGLLLVLSPLGVTVNGSRSWIHLPGGFSLQPAELAKIALCIGLAMILAEGRDSTRPPRWTDVLTAWVLAGIPIALILAQPDLGSALVLGSMTVGVVVNYRRIVDATGKVTVRPLSAEEMAKINSLVREAMERGGGRGGCGGDHRRRPGAAAGPVSVESAADLHRSCP